MSKNKLQLAIAAFVVAVQADSVNVAHTRRTDSLRMDFTLRFDSLTYTLYNDSGTHVKSIVSIRKGAISKVQEQTRCTSINDSTAVRREVHREEVFVPPQRRWKVWVIAWLLILALMVWERRGR